MKTITTIGGYISPATQRVIFRWLVKHWCGRCYAWTSRLYVKFVRWYVLRHPALGNYPRVYLGELSKVFQDHLDNHCLSVPVILKIAFLLHLLGSDDSVALSVQKDIGLPIVVFSQPHRLRVFLDKRGMDFKIVDCGRVNFSSLIDNFLCETIGVV
ncbi:MAG: hypothetical protein PHC51_08145 [bacterium]|nr:hypothetical protein [bacterium]